MSESWGGDHIPGGGRMNLIEALSVAQHLPAEAIDEAVRRPQAIADAVIGVVTRAHAGETLTPREQNLLFWGIHVLGAARESRLHGPLLDLLRGPAEPLGEIIGDAVGTTLPRIVAGTFGGDPDPLERALMDREADEFVRWNLFGAYAYLCFSGAIPRERAQDVLVRFDTERPARAGDAAWTGWEETIALLGFEDLAPRVAAAHADARLLADENDGDWFQLTLAEAVAKPQDSTRFDERELGLIGDVVAELEAALEADEDAPPIEPLENPLRHVGRNDPCPCGSGKKFKKCCLGIETEVA
jgi:uncharacterized protein